MAEKAGDQAIPTKAAMDEQPFQPEDEHVYDGVVLPATVPVTTMEALKSFEVRDDDVFIITYPKSGTTWLQEMMSLIYNDCDVSKIKDTPLFMRMPFLEHHVPSPADGQMVPVYPMVNQMPSPRLIKTHLPFKLLPPQISEKKPKIIYIGRNVKDTAVSYYHFHHWNNMLKTVDKWDDFFQRFVAGDVCWGSWFEHVLGYWNNRKDDNILFLKFEEMKEDLAGQVDKISQFVNKPLTNKQKKTVVEWCSFESMKKNPNSNLSSIPKQFYNAEAPPFMRKGSRGSWREVLTVAQSEILDEMIKEKLKDVDLVLKE